MLFYALYDKLLEVKGGSYMTVVLLIISIMLIAIVLLQGAKAESAMSALTGANDALFKNRKERGGELFITRLTAVLGATFFIICIVISYL